MKRALLPIVAAVLVLSACGEESSDTARDATASNSATASSSTTSATADSTPASAINDEVRAACQLELVKQVPDATFPSSGTLRATSDAEGKLYTVTGTAQVGGAAQPYTCSVLAGADGITVNEATLG